MGKKNRNDRFCVFETPMGRLRLTEDETGICAVEFTEAPVTKVPPGSRYLEAGKAQLLEYFAGQRKVFDLPLALSGTDFQTRVWNALRDIPYGETRSYQQIAAAVGNPKATRAVGMANNRNPLPILLPCHRVVGKNGSLTGYAGGLERKECLLKLEADK